MGESARFRHRMSQRAHHRHWRPQQEQLIPQCPACQASEPAACEYEKAIGRLGLSPDRKRPRGCLSGGPGELPEGF